MISNSWSEIKFFAFSLFNRAHFFWALHNQFVANLQAEDACTSKAAQPGPAAT